MARKKTPAQLGREIDEVVPGWARGLDLSESRRLARELKTSPEELARKERTIESDRVARLPSLRIKMRQGPGPRSNVPRGVYIYVSSPGIGHSNVWAVADLIKSFGYAPRVEPRYVFVASDADLGAGADQIANALRGRGYRVEMGSPWEG
jgi:hypothetical protein